MISKKAFKTFFSYHWYVFLTILIVVFVSYYYIFEAINTPSLSESVRVFIASSYVDKTSLEKKLFVNFEETKIKEVSIDYSDPASSNFSTVFQTRGLTHTDLIVLPIDVVGVEHFTRFFLPLDGVKMSDYLTEISLEFIKDSNNVSYGVKLSAAAKEFITGDKDYYLFFNQKTDKALGLKNSGINQGAIITMENFFWEPSI